MRNRNICHPVGDAVAAQDLTQNNDEILRSRCTPRRMTSGFTILELTIVIGIIGLLAGTGISMGMVTLDQVRYTNTNTTMNTIVAALNRFYAANLRLPCPAQGTLKAGDAMYGREIYSNGSGTDIGCDTANALNVTAIAAAHAANTPAGTASTGTTGTWIRQGTVPTRALSLPDTMMYDEYGNKFTYVVTEKLTTSPIDKTSASFGLIKVNDGMGNTVIPANSAAAISGTNPGAAFALVSHGIDRKGGYNAAGINTNPACSTTGLDRQNCLGWATPAQVGILTETQYNNNKAAPATWYDDQIKWEDKNKLIGLIAQSTATAVGGVPIKAIGDTCTAATSGTAPNQTATEGTTITTDRTSLLSCQSGNWRSL